MASLARMGLAAFFAMFCAAAPAATLRLYFSTTGLTGGRLTAPPPEYVSQMNPGVIPGMQIYLYASVIDAGMWNGVSLDYTGAMGPVTLVNSTFQGLHRWNANSDFMGNLNGTDSTNLVAIQEFGLQNPHLFDAQDDLAITGVNGAVHFYLGAAALNYAGEGFLHVGTAGISRSHGDATNDLIYFGWGDAPLRGNQFGAASAYADFIWIPEVGSAAGLIVLVVILARGRARSSRIGRNRPTRKWASPRKNLMCPFGVSFNTDREHEWKSGHRPSEKASQPD